MRIKPLLTVLFLITAILITAPAALADGEFTYAIMADNTCQITGYTGSSSVLNIPATIDGYTVTEIGYGAFDGCSGIVSAVVPDGVTRIWNYAFANCDNLTSISLPDNVVSIDWQSLPRVSIYTNRNSNTAPALSRVNCPFIDPDFPQVQLLVYKDSGNGRTIHAVGCEASAVSIVLPSDVTVIGESAFKNCQNLTSISLPDSLTTIGDSAFYNCSSLKSITIPNSVTTICDSAFQECRSLTSISIPSSVTSIGEEAFDDCHSLTTIYLPDNITSIGSFAFLTFANTTIYANRTSDTALALAQSKYSFTDPEYPQLTLRVNVDSGDARTLSVMACNQDASSISFPSNVTCIGYAAFQDCENLTKITIPSSVTMIDDYAFSHCSNLKSITLPDGLTSIGNFAFEYCSSLQRLPLPDSILSIGTLAFPTQTIIEFGANDVIETYCKENMLQYVSNSGNTVAGQFTSVEDKIAWIVKTYITSDMSEYTKAFTLYKWLCVNVAYDFDYLLTGHTTNKYSPATAQGPLLGGTAICDGFSRAYMQLLEAVGIEAVRVVGFAYGDSHAWNLAKIDNKWYQFDVTVDEQFDGLFFKYFGLTDEAMSLDHTQKTHLNIVCDAFQANCNYRKGDYDKSIANLQNAILTSISQGVYSATVSSGDAVDAIDGCTISYIVEQITDWPMNGSVELVHNSNRTPLGGGGWMETPSSSYTYTFTSNLLPGDANGDKHVNAYDLLPMLQHLANWDTTMNTDNADMDMDGIVTLRDLEIILESRPGSSSAAK